MLFPAYCWPWPEMHILISEHRDGELITQVIRRLGFSVIRGSTTRGGTRALREMTLRVDRGHLCVTPDGPRGPRRSVHQGVAYLSSRTGFPVVGTDMAFKPSLAGQGRLGRFCVPRPFSPAACVVPPPVIVPPDADRATLEDCPRREVERRMKAMQGLSMGGGLIRARAGRIDFRVAREASRDGSGRGDAAGRRPARRLLADDLVQAGILSPNGSTEVQIAGALRAHASARTLMVCRLHARPVPVGPAGRRASDDWSDDPGELGRSLPRPIRTRPSAGWMCSLRCRRCYAEWAQPR